MQKPLLWTIPQPQYSNDQLEELEQKIFKRLKQVDEKQHHCIFTSSLSVEDMVITHAINALQQKMKIVVLDTGMLNKETTDLIVQTEQFFQIKLHIYQPDKSAVNDYIAKYGKYAMYESLALRKMCCEMRKILPLNQALKDVEFWITGQRSSQSQSRSSLSFEEYDKQRQLVKLNPIYDFSENDVWAYVHHHQLPINALYHQGYPSIGCEPCSKAIRADEDIRAGRWWWENASNKECGLHNH